jgi:YaaC-like Protein
MKEYVWNKLLEFETRDLVERFIKKKHQREASARQILEISSNFIQSREYFINSQRADISVKPLLQYYGVSALTRGLILAISPRMSEAAMKPSHGLDSLNWQETLSMKKFEDLTVKIGKGTFYEMLNATSNKTYFKHHSNGVSFKINFDLPTIGTEIRFADLVQTISDLSEVYETWTQENLCFLQLATFKSYTDLKEYQYTVTKPRIDNGEIAKIFPKEDFGDYSITESGNQIIIRSSNKFIPQFSQRFLDHFYMGIGEIVLTKNASKKLKLNTLGQLYSLSFFLGMLSRYFPSIWISLGRTEKGDAIYPLFIRAIEIIETHFPRTVLEFLESPYDFEK